MVVEMINSLFFFCFDRAVRSEDGTVMWTTGRRCRHFDSFVCVHSTVVHVSLSDSSMMVVFFCCWRVVRFLQLCEQ